MAKTIGCTIALLILVIAVSGCATRYTLDENVATAKLTATAELIFGSGVSVSIYRDTINCIGREELFKLKKNLFSENLMREALIPAGQTIVISTFFAGSAAVPGGESYFNSTQIFQFDPESNAEYLMHFIGSVDRTNFSIAKIGLDGQLLAIPVAELRFSDEMLLSDGVDCEGNVPL